MRGTLLMSIAKEIPFVMLDAAFKSFVLLIATAGITWFLRKRAAATVHRLWTLAFCGLIAVPFVSPLLPTWSLSVVPKNWSAEPIARVESTQSTARSTDSPQGQPSWLMGQNEDRLSPSEHLNIPSDARVTMETSLPIAGAASAATPGAALPPSASNGPIDSRGQAISPKNWGVTLLSVWALGVLLCLLRILRDHVLLTRILRRGQQIRDQSWSELKKSVAQALGLGRDVELHQLPDALSPMIMGIRRSIILLPADANHWDMAHRRLVLLHEMAHAKRHDVLSQLMVQVVCAVYWFNPLAWYGMTQTRKLRELACDDLVLASGHRPSEYAHVLLDVARTCRHRRLVTAVGMARSSDVEGRITALLDSVRCHLSLTKRTARSLLVLTASVVVLIASMRLQSQADQPVAVEKSDQTSAQKKPEPVSKSPGSEEKQTEPTAEKTPEFRKMTVNVRDEDGKPLAGTRIQVSVWEMNNKKTILPTLGYVTGDEGSVEVKLPSELYILRLWATQPKYVPMFVNIDRGRSDIGPLLPKSFDFVLSHGEQMSGQVVDEKGQPVAGVRVLLTAETLRSVQTNPNQSLITKPVVMTRGQTMTDQDGHWKVDDVPKETPAEKYEIHLKLEHADFGSDDYFFGTDRAYVKVKKGHGITTEMLRSGNAKLVMNRGTRITGTVVDSVGKPVTKGKVVWNNGRYLGVGEGEISLNEQGEFRTPALPAGEHPITVIVPGFMPELRKVRVPDSAESLHFVMQPGKRLTMTFVDSLGNSVPGVNVNIEDWRGVYALEKVKFPKPTNDEGVFVWGWAPEDAVTFRIDAKGMAPMTLALAAKESEHVITLNRPLTISGRVSDLSTGKSISKFTVIPVVVFRPQFLQTDYEREASGRNGEYQIKDIGQFGDNRQFQIRVEAEGSRTSISERTFTGTDGLVSCDFALEPAPALTGQVVDTSGRPIVGAVVIQGTPSAVPQVHNNRLEGKARKTTTDNEGRFEIASSFEPVKLRIVHDTGFAEVIRQVDEAPGKITLQPWAKISGTLKQNGSPIADQRISFFPVISGKLGDPRIQGAYSVETDSNGHFEFDQLPPIEGSLKASLGPWQDSPLTSSQSVPLSLRPSENRTVSLGGEGVSVRGKVVATGRGDTELNKKWSLNYLIRRGNGIELPQGFPALGFDPKKLFQSSWHMDERFHDWLSTRENYFVKLSPDGDFNINGVPAGEYDLSLQLYEQPEGCLVETVGQRVVSLVITEADVASGKKEIGPIEVECRIGPRIGQNMQAYKFIDVQGRQQSVLNMEGRYVLMHVWASWCSPCLEKMPSIQSTVQRSSEKRIMFVGLNIDDDPIRAKELVANHKWNWSQNYLGGHSDMAKQLAVSSVPTYYLINPDGLLVTSTTDWSVIEKKIDSLKDEPRFRSRAEPAGLNSR